MSYGKLRRHLACVLAQARGEQGQALFEVALVLTLVALAAVLALGALGVAIAGYFDPVADAMGL